MNSKEILKHFLFFFSLIIIITLLSPNFLSLRETYLGGATQAYVTNPLLYSRSNFDGNHYVYIATRGYGHLQQAFFPLYPLTIKYLIPILGDPQRAGVAISSISYFLALLLLSRLIRVDYSQDIAKYTLIALIFFPTSFYFSFIYTEGLFFLLVVSSFYFGRTNRWWLAGAIGALAAYTRFIGIFLIPALLVEAWLQKRQSIKSTLAIGITAFGLLLFMSFLKGSVGDPLAFIHVQKYFGQGRSENIILLPQVIWRYIKMIITVNKSDPLYLTIIFEFIVGVLFACLSFYSVLKTRLSYAVFSILAFITPTLTGSFTSMPRYVLVCLSSFLVLSQIFQKKQKLLPVYICTSIFITAIYLAMFVRGYWVA